MSNAIEFKNVSKSFRKGEKVNSLRDALPKLFNIFRKNAKRTDSDLFWALDNINLNIRQGETLGIIGPNGAGKTTMLKLISGILRPNIGSINVNGRISSLIEIGAGFHPDLTGRENIYLNGSIMGMGRKEITSKFDSIVDFAGIEEFIDTPVKRYSSGMYVRLGFSVAIHTDPDILLVDEVLAVGDMSFQIKCVKKINELKKNNATILFISHNLATVAEICNKTIFLNKGRIEFHGDTSSAIDKYHQHMQNNLVVRRELKEVKEFGIERYIATKKAIICSVELFNDNGGPVFTVNKYDHIKFRVEVVFKKDLTNPIFGFFIKNTQGIVLTDVNTLYRNIDTGFFKSGDKIMLEYVLKMKLTRGTYYFGTGVAYSDLKAFCDWKESALTFTVLDDGGTKGLVDLDSQIFLDKKRIG
ncbi:MAG: ABC transporter ATP-binding protein [Candidatus Omnitrophica bacterium]|nr:ABC transporter ATP-binding protein [Candidatus Omnitrophota bacterium]